MRRAVDIFLNYPGGSLEDSEHVRWLDQLLGRYSLRTWIGERDRQAQGDREDVVIKTLDSAPVFMACLGVRPAGGWGRQEIDRAAARAKKDPDFAVCAVLLPGAESRELDTLPPLFAEGPVFDLRAGVTSVASLMPFLWQRLDPQRADFLRRIVAACEGIQRVVALSGPMGSGKSALAQVVAATLNTGHLDGHAYLQYEPQRGIDGTAKLALKILRLRVKEGGETYLHQYHQRLGQGRYFIVLDEVDGVDVSKLVPPTPSTVLVIAREDPHLPMPHAHFTMPRPSDRLPEVLDRGGLSTRPGYISDAPGGVDLLGIQDSVGALCSVIAAKDVKPPLSIGLFGDWGTGKTFFIEKMRERVDEIATASQKADRSAYCASIRQVVFNAWHYADSDLWASLASRVFEGLAEAGGKREDIVERLASSRLELDEAKADCVAAKRRMEQAREMEEEARRDAESTEFKLSDLGRGAVDLFRDEAEIDPLLGKLSAELHPDHDVAVTVATVRELNTTTGFVRELWRQSRGLTVLVVVLATIAGGLAVLGADLLAAAPALAALAAVARLILGPLKTVNRAAVMVRERVDSLRHQQEAELRDRLGRLQKEEADATRRQEKARRQVDEAELAIEEIKSGKRLFRFIEERSRVSPYEPYQGVVALVRKDFERLAELMDSGGDGAPHLERIVLYIDDLDRCPAERVVQMLEAIHLLMSSQLFVVVVAVDPHWLLRSLEHHYENEMKSVERRGLSPTPHDYLEKIFQIPFTLPRMEEEGFERLIGNLLPVHDDAASPRSGEPPSAAGLGPAPALDSSVGRVPPSDYEPVSSAAWGRDIDLLPEGLRILEEELDFMARLGGILRTPRGAKRFTNIYRLIRASLPQHRLDALVGEGGVVPEFRCVQLLLAVVVGSPSLATPLCAAVLEEVDDGSWWELVDRWRRLHEGMASLRDEPLPDLATFARWVPDVSRYSYDAALLASGSAVDGLRGQG